MRTRFIALCLLSAMTAAGLAQTGVSAADTTNPAQNTARRWLAAKFLDQADHTPPTAHMRVTLKSGVIQKDRRKDRTFLIAGRMFQRGFFMPSPGEIVVHLPEPAAFFEAVVGVDSNDLGYYANAGRGNVIASVSAGGRELFRSGVLNEGTPGVPIKADLDGAAEFSLKLTATGERPLAYQDEWDQADWADARVTLASGKVLWLADLPVGPLPTPFSRELPFSFQYAGRSSNDLLKSWSVSRSTRHIDNHRTEYVSTYVDVKTRLEVRAVAVAYDDFPAIEWTLYFKNNGDQPTPILENIQALDTSFERTQDVEFILHHSRGSQCLPSDYQPLETVLEPNTEERFNAVGGRPTDSDLGYFNLTWASKSVIAGLGWPGQWAAKFSRDNEIGVRITAGQELTHFRLLPGEEVRSPLVALLFWEGDWIGAQNNWRRWMVSHNMPRPGGKLPPPHLAGGSGRYTVEMQNANEENQLHYLQNYLDLGIKLDYWWMDAGWYPFKTGWWNTGTWDLDEIRFPNGFAPITAAAHAKGIKTIVWFEPERVTTGSWLSVNHHEWLLGPDKNYWNGPNKLLNLGNPEAWQWLVDHVSAMIREQGIDLYRQDCNFEPLAFWRDNDAEDRQGITEIKHVMGYLAYFDELRRRFPNLPLDTCASGGRRNDLETLRRAVPLWRSDFAYEPSAQQQFTYGMSLWIPYFGTAFNSLDPYIFRSQMTPATWIGVESGLHENGYARLQKLLDSWRLVSDYYYGDYYPLTPYREGATDWLAWQFNRPGQGDGIVQGFRRMESPIESCRFNLRGLDAAAQYAVMDIDIPGETISSGKELMERGLSVYIRDKPGSIIITYKKIPNAQRPK